MEDFTWILLFSRKEFIALEVPGIRHEMPTDALMSFKTEQKWLTY